jgi:predicted nucleotidyltransferase component of viral defense system
MAQADAYGRQVQLLLQVLPHVAEEPDFALKGGTAINLFIRDLPRLSVDIDLTYLPVADRPASLAAIDAGMKRIARRIRDSGQGIKVSANPGAEGVVTKLLVASKGVQVKIEITPVLRGCVYEPELRAVSPAVEDRFGFAEIQVVSFADLFAGKIVAALDRQHPRDLFDVRDLLAAEGVGEELRRAFIVYMLAHHRPMHEVLDPPRKPLEAEFARSFEGMTREPVRLRDLHEAREAIIQAMVAGMPADHRAFLVGFERGEPDWALLGLPGAKDLPAVVWRQVNLDRLDPDRRRAQVDRLKAVLGYDD